MKYGDLVCYRWVTKDPHPESDVMYVGPCTHRKGVAGDDLIDLLFIGDWGTATPVVDCKDPMSWRRCDH